MYAGVASIACGILFTGGQDFINLGIAADPEFLAVNRAFSDFDLRSGAAGTRPLQFNNSARPKAQCPSQPTISWLRP